MNLSLIIPVLNEEKHLPTFLSTLNSVVIPSHISQVELVFVDSGSEDNSFNQISNFKFKSLFYPFQVRSEKKIYPGAARNMGVSHATHDLIAFLDVRTIPHHDWLKDQLSLIELGREVVFGKCIFSGTNIISLSACALSLGIGSEVCTIPGTVMLKKHFILFREDLRSAEDLIWKTDLGKKLSSDFEGSGKVYYQSFPSSFIGIFKKWFLYAQHTYNAGMGRTFLATASASTLLFLYLCIYNLTLAGVFVLIYFVFRGIVDPIRRSKNNLMNQSNGLEILVISPIVSLVIDVAKFIGFIRSFFYRD
jgi:glycosyltransferase involved in cell wall biosynthesis